MRLETVLLSCAIVAAVSGCAVVDRNHLSTTNWVDRTIVPENKVGQWAMTPLLVPTCLVTLAVDNVLIAPAASAPSAYVDTKKFWRHFSDARYEEDLYSWWGFFPSKVLLTPFVFLGDWSARSVFAIEVREEAAWGWPRWGYLWRRDAQGRPIPPETTNDEVSSPPSSEAGFTTESPP